MHDLSNLGFDSFFSTQISSSPQGTPLFPARIASEQRGSYEVWAGDGDGTAHLAGRLRRTLSAIELPRAGDWVMVNGIPHPDRDVTIEQVLNRRTVMTRGAAGQEAREQVIAANMDIVFVVCGLDADYNLHRIERYLARVWASGAQPVIILNKADLCADTDERVADVETRLPGVPVLAVSAVRAEGISPLREQIRSGMTAAFVGSSGAGKSTLINALSGEARLLTNEVRASDGRGRHTTTRRQLLILPGGGLVLDTPGMRELQLLDDEGLDATFSDIEALAAECHFRDCRHEDEPGCAVKAALDDGTLAAERYEHYHKLRREAAAYELRHDAYLRHQVQRVWKSLHKEGEEIRRRKEGR